MSKRFAIDYTCDPETTLTFVTHINSPVVEIQVRQLTILCNGRVLKTRSRALLVFVCVLVRQLRSQPTLPWVGLEGLRAVLTSVHGKQMQRFVDALAEIGFPLGFESKTRGRYWLALPAEAVLLDVDESGLDEFLTPRGFVPQFAIEFQSSPVQSSPVQSSPVQSSPVQSSPVQSSPVQSSPSLAVGDGKRRTVRVAGQDQSG